MQKEERGILEMKKIVLLRHGESAWNKENRFTGWTGVDFYQLWLMVIACGVSPGKPRRDQKTDGSGSQSGKEKIEKLYIKKEVMPKGVELLNTIQNVYLDPEITIA